MCPIQDTGLSDHEGVGTAEAVLARLASGCVPGDLHKTELVKDGGW